MAERASGKSGKRKERPGDFDKVGLGALGVLVVGLAFVVWLALPKDSDLQASADAGAISADAGATDPAPKAAGTLERLGEASIELAVLSGNRRSTSPSWRAPRPSRSSSTSVTAAAHATR